jgi:hypothetical protein
MIQAQAFEPTHVTTQVERFLAMPNTTQHTRDSIVARPIRPPVRPLLATLAGASVCLSAGALHASAGGADNTQFMSGLATAAASGLTTGLSESAARAEEGEDVLIVRRGSSWQELKGTVISETADEIVFEVENFGLRARTTYKMSEVIEVRRAPRPEGGAVADTAGDAADAGGARALLDPRASTVIDDPNTTSVYTIVLDGEFGEDITQSPIRDAVNDAKKHNPDVLLVVVDNNWSTFGGLQDRGDDWFSGEFDRLFQTEAIMPIFIEEIENEWPRDRQPRIVCWVKTAMGGAGFIPLFFPEIYFAPEARMGGMGNLLALFGTMGDAVVREKQFSLRMSAAQGMAIRGGYNELIVNAMTRIDEEIAVEFIGGEPEFILGEAVGEQIQLTDNGLVQGNADTPEQRMRGLGNDVLTLRADMALKLNVSQGTAGTFPELWRSMGIDRTVEVIGDSDGDWVTDEAERIMNGWGNGLRNAIRTLRSLQQDYAEVQVNGNFRQRNAARGRQEDILKEQRRLLVKYGEAIPGSEGMLQNIQFQLDVISLDRIGDRQ